MPDATPPSPPHPGEPSTQGRSPVHQRAFPTPPGGRGPHAPPGVVLPPPALAVGDVPVPFPYKRFPPLPPEGAGPDGGPSRPGWGTPRREGGPSRRVSPRVPGAPVEPRGASSRRYRCPSGPAAHHPTRSPTSWRKCSSPLTAPPSIEIRTTLARASPPAKRSSLPSGEGISGIDRQPGRPEGGGPLGHRRLDSLSLGDVADPLPRGPVLPAEGHHRPAVSSGREVRFSSYAPLGTMLRWPTARQCRMEGQPLGVPVSRQLQIFWKAPPCLSHEGVVRRNGTISSMRRSTVPVVVPTVLRPVPLPRSPQRP